MNPSPRYEELANRLDTYLETFRPTVTLVEDLIEARSNPQEILILLCARLDRFHLVEFPGPFLLNTLKECVERYRQHLLHKGSLPPDVHFAAFDDEMMEYLEFLDEALLPDTKELRLRND